MGDGGGFPPFPPPTPNLLYMIFDIKTLKKVMDSVRQNPAFTPTKKNTFCNFAIYKTIKDLKLDFFWDDEEDRPMLANEMIAEMERNPSRFSKFTDHLRAWEMARIGHLVIAARADVPHGHVAAMYPSDGMITSGKWRTQVGLCNNIGKVNAVQGVNFCFAEPPNYYLVV